MAKAKKPAAKVTAAKPKAKAPARKTAKVVKLKTVAKTKKTVQPAQVKISPVATKQTKGEIFTAIAERVSVDKKVVRQVLEALRAQVQSHMMARGSGEFTVPSLGVKIVRIEKPASKARKGINPFTGEEIEISAKPKRKSIKVRAMKDLKSLAEA